MVPGNVTSPGPGRSAQTFTTPLCVAGMQKTDARMDPTPVAEMLGIGPAVAQPRLSPIEFVERHARSSFGLRSHVPVWGTAGLLWSTTSLARQRGQG
jgi:hypothetical protein